MLLYETLPSTNQDCISSAALVCASTLLGVELLTERARHGLLCQQYLEQQSPLAEPFFIKNVSTRSGHSELTALLRNVPPALGPPDTIQIWR